jgi:hypothetical protein
MASVKGNLRDTSPIGSTNLDLHLATLDSQCERLIQHSCLLYSFPNFTARQCPERSEVEVNPIVLVWEDEVVCLSKFPPVGRSGRGKLISL